MKMRFDWLADVLGLGPKRLSRSQRRSRLGKAAAFCEVATLRIIAVSVFNQITSDVDSRPQERCSTGRNHQNPGVILSQKTEESRKRPSPRKSTEWLRYRMTCNIYKYLFCSRPCDICDILKSLITRLTKRKEMKLRESIDMIFCSRPSDICDIFKCLITRLTKGKEMKLRETIDYDMK